MGKLKLHSKDLRRIGFTEHVSVSVAMQVMQQHYKHHSEAEAFGILEQVLANPSEFLDDPLLGKIAATLVEVPEIIKPEIPLLAEGVPVNHFGSAHIEQAAIEQMKIAARLPVAVAGALMPDAHQGYGLPIGGVLAVKNAVIPYGVGLDIGCRMCLSIFDMPGKDYNGREKQLRRALEENTYFGTGKEHGEFVEDAVLDRSEFDTISILRNMRGKAAKQLGTSGSGNHFVEFGIVTITDANNEWNLPAGDYIGLLSHSGSRGMGATIAAHYTQIAMDETPLPKVAKHMAWLDLNSEAGMEYWLAMNLAGDFAAACHHRIHRKIAKAIGVEPLARIENHHNFAWKEIINGEELIVHRKGATPAAKGETGIIPGSMTAPGYLVRGKGEVTALHSAAHGAGRKMSRGRAQQSITYHALKEMLKAKQVTLIGGGLDEAPQAYKDIDMVMQSQTNLVEVFGSFQPRLVRMDG